MDIKITFDITPKLADLAERVCKAIEHGNLFEPAVVKSAPEPSTGAVHEMSPDESLWSIPYGELLDKLRAAVDAPDLPSETPETSTVSKPVEPPKNEPDAKIDPKAAAIHSETPAPEAKDETPVEPPKPKRSHHKNVEKPAEPAPQPEPQPEPEKPVEPEPQPESVESPTEPEGAPENSAAPEMTLDEVRAVCVRAAKAGKTKVVTDFLGAHNAQSLSKLDPKHYAELAKIVGAALP